MTTISFARHQFPPDIIRHAVWLYLRFTLSFRDVEDLLAERGLDVSYETVRRWVLKFGPLFARELRRCLKAGVSTARSKSSLARRAVSARASPGISPPPAQRCCSPTSRSMKQPSWRER